MPVTNTSVTAIKWLPTNLVCSVQGESSDPQKPKKGYIWKFNNNVVSKGTKSTHDLDFVDDSDKTGWSCEVRGYAQDDADLSGESVEIGIENFTITLFDNEYVEDISIPTSFNVGDELRVKVVYRIQIPQNISTDLYYENGMIASIDGDPGDLDHHWFNIAKFAWPQYSGEYRVELSDEKGDIKFRYSFDAVIRENPAVFNAQKYTPSYFSVEDAPNVDAGHTAIRYRLERANGTLVYESKNKMLFVSKTTLPEHAGEYVACVRVYKENDQNVIVPEDFNEGTRHRFLVNVKDNEFFSDAFFEQDFRYPSGSDVNITISNKPADSTWLKNYGLMTEGVHYAWALGGGVIKNTPYGQEGYNEITLDNVQYDNSVDLQLSVAKTKPNDPTGKPIARPLLYFRKKLDIYDKEHDLGNIEAGEPIILTITDPEPPKSSDPTQTRSLVILKDDVKIQEVPLDTKEFKVTDSADKEHIGVYSHEFRDSPSKDPYSAHDEYDIVSRETYRVNVVPNMEFDGPHHVVINVGDELVLEARMIKPPSNYIPTYEFSKGGRKLAILDNRNPVYRKENAQLSDAGLYKFVAFGDTNNNNEIDPGEVVGYTKYVHVIVNEPAPEPEDPAQRPAHLVTIFNEFGKGRVSPCPYWVIDELVELIEDPLGWSERINDAIYYDWQITIFNEFLKGRDLFLQDSCNGYWAIVRQRDMSIETGYGRFKHYLTRNP